MRLFATTLLGCAVAACLFGPAVAQDPPKPTKPVELFQEARDLIGVGKFDLAAERLKAFRDSNPADADFLEIERRFGAATFLKLRNVAKWDDNPTADADAKKVVDDILAKSVEVNTKLNRDPARVAKFVRNLGASPAEQEFATDQLKLAGDAVPPVLIAELRSTNENALRTGIFAAVSKLPASAVPGLLAAIDGLPDDQKAQMLKAVAQRQDLLQLVDKAETDLTPHLWYHSASPTPSLQVVATSLLDALTGGKAARKPVDAELVRLTEPLIDHKAGFASLDRMTNKVRVWSWDKERQAVKVDEVSAAAAEEYYGLRNLKWALERVPKSEAAQSAFLALATERAVGRANFTDLSKGDPGVYRLLAAAPQPLLSSLLDTALAENRTALAVGVLQAMSDRGQRDIPTTASAKSTPYARALGYPDPRVQFAAAVALLRAPGTATTASRSTVVDVMHRALLADLDGAAEGKTGRAIIADPDAARGAKMATAFRDIGYAAEAFGTGRDLLRRVGKAADFDLIVLDRHVADPLLTDVLGQLTGDPNAGRRRVLVVASADRPKPVPVEAMLLRLAILIAATDPAEADPVPPSYVFNPQLPDLDRDKARAQNVELRDDRIAKLFGELRPKPPGRPHGRVARLLRLLEAADLPSDRPLQEQLDARLAQLTYAVLAAEHAVTPTSAPKAAKALDEYTTRVRVQPATENPLTRVKDTANLGRIVLQLEGELTADGRKKFEALQLKLSPGDLLLDVGAYRDEDLERKLAKQVKGYPTVSVVPEPFSSVNLAFDVQATTDPSQLPRTAEEKKAAAKIAAGWLRKIATGEVEGYDAKPAEAAMRSALRSDELAPEVIDGLAKLGSGDTQVSLVQVAITATRPLPIRLQATDAATRHVQAFGKQTPGMQVEQVTQEAASELDPVLSGKLAVLARVLSATPADLGGIIQKYPVNVPTPPAPKVDAPKDPVAPKDPPKQPEEPKK